MRASVTAVTDSFISYVALVTPAGGRLIAVQRPSLLSRLHHGTGSLARQLLVLQALVVGVVVVATATVAYLDAQRAVRHDAEVRARAIVRSLADSPLVVDAVTGPVARTESPSVPG